MKNKTKKNKFTNSIVFINQEINSLYLQDLTPLDYAIPTKNESMVSFVSRRYMRVVNGSLVVCLSEYLPLRSVYILVIKVQDVIAIDIIM